MKVLVINELYQRGGSEIQTLREVDLLRSHGHEVWHITLDPDAPEPDSEYRINIPSPPPGNIISWVKEWCYRWFLTDRKLYRQLTGWYEKIGPDIIHLNVFNNKPITIYKSVGKYKCVQTVRDFSAVCPKAVCVKKDYSACGGYLSAPCLKDCMPDGSMRDKLRFRLYVGRLKRMNRIRRKNIDRFICPSQNLSDTCCNNSLITRCVNNPFDFSLVRDNVKNLSTDPRIYLVYGLVTETKGIRQIVDAFSDFAEGKNAELHIIGAVEEQFREEFEKLCGSPYVKYLGYMPNKEIIRYLEKVYCVIVPSLWLENYPNTALEGIAARCLVIGSDRGGIPELIQNDRLVFNILEKSSLISILEYADNMPPEEYERIISENFGRISVNNSLDLYYERLMKHFNELLNGSSS